MDEKRAMNIYEIVKKYTEEKIGRFKGSDVVATIGLTANDLLLPLLPLEEIML